MAKYGVVFSGGLDSTVLLYDLVHKYGKDEVVAIGIDFGQKQVTEDRLGNSFANNLIETRVMKTVTDKLGVHLHIVDLGSLGFVLEFMQKRIQKYGARTNNNKSLSLFPGRNFILAFVAAAVAETYGCEELCMGFPKTDYINGIGSYTSSKEFLDELNKLADKSADLSIKFTTPLHHLSKAGEVLLGKELGVNFVEDVWTCLHPKEVTKVVDIQSGSSQSTDAEYETGHIQCGLCKPCVRNRAAFIMADVPDPYEYANQKFIVDERNLTQFKLAGDDIKKLVDHPDVTIRWEK